MQHIPFDLEMYRSQMHRFLGDSAEADVFWRALDFATEAHDDQWRRSGDAYILHPCSVAKVLAEEMDIVHPEILAAALLHDTVEDVEEVTIEVVGEHFGSYVQAIVEGCTKVTHFSGDKQSHLKLVHRKIFSGAALRPEVMLVKLADRLHNLRTLQAMPKRKRQKIAEETIDIYAPLAAAFGLFNMKREMFNLALSYKFPKKGAKLMGQIQAHYEVPETKAIVETLREETRAAQLECTVDIRVKELWAYYDSVNHILLKAIDYPCEILIIVEDTQACYRALGIVNQTFRPIPRTIRDFIANPKPTGYQGLHARAIVKGKRILFKIRTEEMARRAQRGLFRNWSSKTGKQRRFIREIQEMFDVLGSDESVSYRDVIAASGQKEIYTYTPQGDLICLPIKSTVLDFAFRVHTAIGHSCLGAMVGNKRVSPSTTLWDGQMVRIIRADGPVQFEPQMLEACRTARARTELSKGFRLRRRAVAQEVGQATFRQEMRRYGLDTGRLVGPGLETLLRRLQVRTIEEMYSQIGSGRLRLPGVIEQVKQQFFGGTSPLVTPTGEFNKIELVTLDPVSIKFSACCKPSPVDKGNCALMTDKGLSVHHTSCPKLHEIKFQREDAIGIRWRRRQTVVSKKQNLFIPAIGRRRIMMILGVAPEDMKILELIVLTKTPTRTPAWQVVFSVPHLEVLSRVLKHFDKSGIQYEFELDY